MTRRDEHQIPSSRLGFFLPAAVAFQHGESNDVVLITSGTSEQAFWSKVAAHVGDAYLPYDSATGVFLFRQKLLRRGFDGARAVEISPALLARAVPWALFFPIAGEQYLRRATYGWPVRCFTCFDVQFELYLVA